ncbi:MAG: hypothetical protein CL840_20475 [Crocinitomicaceae bacterium]|nr:hypothetical protein [Crocinitomicaceae bacterium]|tara:strand:+ start:6017 stop:7531 length:1515 start_codon:yes stop_codon:yes gene_type:complete
MINSRPLKIVFLLVGALLFNYLFWGHPPGVNLTLFSTYLLVIVVLFHRKSLSRIPVLASIAAVLITSLAFTYHGSGYTFVIHFVSIFILVGFINQQGLRSIPFALPTALVNFWLLPSKFVKAIKEMETKSFRISSVFRFIRIAVIPVVLLLVFVFIFSVANPIFEGFIVDISEWFYDLMITLFDEETIFRSLFILWGTSLVAWVLIKNDVGGFASRESKLSEWITRTRKPRAIRHQTSNVLRSTYSLPKRNPLGLKNEYRSALILLVCVNLLIAIVNGIDINWIWFGFEYDGEMSLSNFVHEGTFFLILSIFLSMAIMLYYFRKNQNFYYKRKFLLVLASIWIAQNAIMVISVALRNIHYIEYYGLAYKRIGVFFFLAATLFGLLTLTIKIHKRKSGFYLWRVNAWSVLAVLVISSSIYWDGIIAKYNLEHQSVTVLDESFLFSLSNGVLPLLDSELRSYSSKKMLDSNTSRFVYNYEALSWQSWNYVDYQAFNYLKNNNHENR